MRFATRPTCAQGRLWGFIFQGCLDVSLVASGHQLRPSTVDRATSTILPNGARKRLGKFHRPCSNTPFAWLMERNPSTP